MTDSAGPMSTPDFVVLGMIWRGARTGYEIKKWVATSIRFFWTISEAQIYPTVIALIMKLTGESVWPGQLLSLSCVAAAIALIAAALAKRYGEPAAFAALLAMLGHQGTIAMATFGSRGYCVVCSRSMARPFCSQLRRDGA